MKNSVKRTRLPITSPPPSILSMYVVQITAASMQAAEAARHAVDAERLALDNYECRVIASVEATEAAMWASGNETDALKNYELHKDVSKKALASATDFAQKVEEAISLANDAKNDSSD